MLMTMPELRAAIVEDKRICERCGGTFANWGLECPASLADMCQGFRVYDANRPLLLELYEADDDVRAKLK